ncbi:MAG: DUF3048 domain-containing protein, partial [Oscillospiraceae bacterium]|nr:DUF3048 domain-containing protein [Oscillospiraceae bacterium]
MKRITTLAISVALTLALAAAFSACKTAEDGAEETPEFSMLPVITITPTPEPTPPPYTGKYNPLSGLPIAEELVNARPLAIMLNNRKIAQPQLGISQADIIFEVPAEGGITRMLAIFQDVSAAGPIGSVRSSRPYYIDLAEGFDSIYICAGGSPDAYTTLKNRKITYLDGVNGSRQEVYYRDKERRKTMGYEHSLVTSGELLNKYIPTYDFRTEHEAAFRNPLQFEADYDLRGGQDAGAVKLDFSGKTTAFAYNAETADYRMTQYNNEYKDGNNGQRVTFANVVVLKTAISAIKGDTEGRLTVKTTGDGDGFLAIGGKYVPIKWSKASNDAPLVFTDAAGNAVTLRSGHTYIGVMSTTAKVEFSEAEK